MWEAPVFPFAQIGFSKICAAPALLATLVKLNSIPAHCTTKFENESTSVGSYVNDPVGVGDPLAVVKKIVYCVAEAYIGSAAIHRVHSVANT